MSLQDSREILNRMKLGVRLGVAQALAEHKRAGQSIVVWQDGKIVKIPPEEIVVPKVDENESF